ncbi:30S ribosomal protein S3 [Candidatus Woesearchaeota archaeon]|nr:30S ribosomal protein S3 [Candidatus Woesearchaeota archaeon]
MIEKKFVMEKLKEFEIGRFITKQIGTGKFSFFEIKKTPLGEKIVIHTARPGLIVGKKGETIKLLTAVLKDKFKMDNPQIEVVEVTTPDLDAQSVAEHIVGILERFGAKRFKSLGYQSLQRIMDAGALGAEIVIGGRGVPSERAKSWRFYNGYLKKCGEVAVSQVNRGFCVANLKSGSVGVKVKIMPSTVQLPDRVQIIRLEAERKPQIEQIKEEVISQEQVGEAKESEKKEDKPKKSAKKKSAKAPTKKTTTKKGVKQIVKEKDE